MSNISQSDISNSVNKINKIYDNLSYLDLYGNSVMVFLFVTFTVFLIYSYFTIVTNTQPIKDDWVNQRCKPRIIPFAGLINKPDNKTVFEYTEENFNFCVQNILTNISGFALQPFTFLISSLTKVFNSIQIAIDNLRVFVSGIRTNVQKIAESVLNSILNVIIPVQQIFIGLKDSLSKMQSILTAGLYTSLGTYYTLKSLMGAIAQFIIIILTTLAALIVGLWILPFTWPMALANTLIFISIAIPLTIMVLFMTQVLNVQTEGIPKVPSCFDKGTLLEMSDGTQKTIEKVEVGDILKNNDKVICKLKLSALGQEMYYINNIVVSGSHVLKYQGKWIPVRLHPERIPIANYGEPYIYCLNTSSKTIQIKGTVFADWDELYEDILDRIVSKMPTTKKDVNNLHKYFCGGFAKGTQVEANNTMKTIETIEIGDNIKGDIVYGIVEIDAKDFIVEDLGNNIYGSSTLKTTLKESNNKLDLDLDKKDKLYHLLTYSKKLIIGSNIFSDYDSFIDENL